MIISDICKVLKIKEPQLVYIDKDGDKITTFSEKEMEEAIFKDNITKFQWNAAGGASTEDFGPRDPSSSQ